MKNQFLNIVTMVLALGAFNTAHGNSDEAVCTTQQCRLYQKGVNQTKEAVTSVTPEASVSALHCPVGGVSAELGELKRRTTLPNAEGALKTLRERARLETQVLEQDGSKCGFCRQVNLVSPFTVTRPGKLKSNALCENRPTKTIQKKFTSEKEAKSFAERALKGKNTEGKDLYQGCPDPCSFSVFNSETQMQDGFVVTLVVQCGQPRSGSVLFANYDFSYGKIHQWSCQ